MTTGTQIIHRMIAYPTPERTAPKFGQKYFMPYFSYGYPKSESRRWFSLPLDWRNLERGLVHLTPKAALEHARALWEPK
jgi:hypothetical protein